MSNLIITIIAIMILASIVLASAYYGGTAYLDARANAYANTLITQSTQIASTWLAWRRNKAGADLTDYIWGDSNAASDFISSYYLAAMPKPPADLFSSSYVYNFYFPIKRSNYAVTGSGDATTFRPSAASTPVDTIIVAMEAGALRYSVCNKIAALSGGTVVVTTFTGNLTASMTSNPFGVMYVDDNTSGAFDTADRCIFYYKAF